MSDPIFGVLAKKWVAQCLHRYLPKNYTGVFKIYWKNVRKSVGVAKDIYPEGGDATIDPKEGEGIRFMFRYKEGKRHGLSVGFLPNGKLKSFRGYEIHRLWHCHRVRVESSKKFGNRHAH